MRNNLVQMNGQAAETIRRSIEIKRCYLHLPVRTGGCAARLCLSINGRVVCSCDVELSADPELWVFVDVSAWKGKTITLSTSSGFDQALNAIFQADEIPGADRLYRETYRPQVHFTTRRGWMNDPNGLVYYEGEWHLFYQHNPHGWNLNINNVHWGHAVSTDLFHWKELGDVIHPRLDVVGSVFSGSAVVDKTNTSGWKQGSNATIVAAMTDTGAGAKGVRHGMGECLAYSNDRGRTFTMYENNPVVQHRGRDPKIVWHEPTRRWVMAVYDEPVLPGGDVQQCIAFYSSPDLQSWQFESRIEGFFSCPNLFEMFVDGDRSNTRWVLYSANGQYMLGEFDGKTFTPEHKGKYQLWHGNFYASQTYDNAPDDRRVQIGWSRGVSFPSMPFNQQLTVPVELTLRKAEEGISMFAEPVRELAALRSGRRSWKDVTLQPGDDNALKIAAADATEIDAVFRVGSTGRIVLSLRGASCVYNRETEQIHCLDLPAMLKPMDGRIRLHLLLDRGSVECFANDGRVAISKYYLAPSDNTSIRLSAEGAAVTIQSLDVYDLQSIWQESSGSCLGAMGRPTPV